MAQYIVIDPNNIAKVFYSKKLLEDALNNEEIFSYRDWDETQLEIYEIVRTCQVVKNMKVVSV